MIHFKIKGEIKTKVVNKEDLNKILDPYKMI